MLPCNSGATKPNVPQASHQLSTSRPGTGRDPGHSNQKGSGQPRHGENPLGTPTTTTTTTPPPLPASRTVQRGLRQQVSPNRHLTTPRTQPDQTSLGWWWRRRRGRRRFVGVGLWLLPVFQAVAHSSPRLRDEFLHRLPLGGYRRMDDQPGVLRLVGPTVRRQREGFS